MNILLLDAQGAGSSGRAIVEWIPAGLRNIGGILEQKKTDYDLAVVEEFIKNPEKYRDYKAFFISAMSSDLPIVKQATDIIKTMKKPLILGGPITFDIDCVFDRLNINVAVIGEGERAVIKLLESGLNDGEIPVKEELSQIKGIAYRNHDGGIKVNPQDDYLTKDELNSIHPSTSIVTYYPYYNYVGVALEILRGCSNFHRAKDYHGKNCPPECNNCTSEDLKKRLKCPIGVPAGCGFCSVGGLYGPPRSREQDAIIEEMKELIEKGVTKISFLVPDPLDYKREELVAPAPLTDPVKPEPNYEELEKLCTKIWDIDEVAQGNVMVTMRDVKATLVTERTAGLLKKYFSSSIIGLGCESGSEEHCNKLGRGYSPREVERATTVLNNHGILPKINLIVGLPGQDEKTVEKTLALMERLEDTVLYFDAARFESLPATAFEDCPSDFGPIKDENIKRLFNKVNSIHERHIKEHIGERWRVLIGVYDNGVKTHAQADVGKGPRRKFRQLAGVVGYPISQTKDLSLMATVVRIIEPPPGLKTGELKNVEIEGYSQMGFRVIPEGKIV